MKNVFTSLFILVSFLLHAQNNDIKHVILIGVDGMGANYLKKADNIPNMKMMMREGSYSMRARCTRPSSSAVNWAAMTMGANPSLTGYTEWDSKKPEIPSRVTGKYGMFPSIIEILREQKPQSKIDVFYTWSGIGYLFPKQAVDHELNTQKDSLTLAKAITAIKTEKPNFLFLHFDDVDGAGHGIGWGTSEYYAAIEKMDERIGKIMQTVKEEGMLDNTVILVTADHGGKEKGHGGKSIEEIEIPWIIYGKGVKKGHKIDQSIMTFDTASTIAWIFNVNQPQVWVGRPVKAAFKK